MPLLPDGTWVCVGCEKERAIADDEWLLSDADPTVFTSPPCTCGNQETFCWHDDIELMTVLEKRDLPPTMLSSPDQSVVVSWVEPNPNGFHAKHMVSIEKVAKKLGRKQKKLNPHGPEIKYSKKPTAHTAAEMRNDNKMRGKAFRERPALKTKEVAAQRYVEAVAKQKEDNERFIKEKKEHKQERTQRVVDERAVAQEGLPEPTKALKEKLAKPEVDKIAKVNNKPSGD